MKVLITGGAGYIGSTIASACLDHGITPVILDSLVTGREEFAGGRTFYRGDVSDGDLFDRVFREHPDIAAVVHCAALIVVPDSVREPLRYYRENVTKGIEMIGHVLRNGCHRLLFSSSASFYEPGEDFSVDEDSVIAPQSPYARTKAVLEMALADISGGSDLRAVSLRYFNPIGTDPQLRTGLQAPNPSHALGKMIEARRTGRPFRLTGVTWPTRDGSAIRDYVHVWDLALAHVAVLERFDALLPADGPDGNLAINLGTGRGTTVRELLQAFEAVTGEPLPTVETEPRPGDVVGAYTRSTRARDLLDWQAGQSTEDGIRDTLRWFDVRHRVLGR